MTDSNSQYGVANAFGPAMGTGEPTSQLHSFSDATSVIGQSNMVNIAFTFH